MMTFTCTHDVANWTVKLWPNRFLLDDKKTYHKGDDSKFYAYIKSPERMSVDEGSVRNLIVWGNT